MTEEEKTTKPVWLVSEAEVIKCDCPGFAYYDETIHGEREPDEGPRYRYIRDYKQALNI